MLPRKRLDDKTLFSLPSLGSRVKFDAAGGLDRGFIDNFSTVDEIGLFNLLAPNLLTLLAKNNVRFLWLYERRCVKSRQWRWITRRYLLDVQALVQWLVTSRALGHPYYCVDDRGDAWLLVPAHLLERRRYTRQGGKIGGAR